MIVGYPQHAVAVHVGSWPANAQRAQKPHRQTHSRVTGSVIENFAPPSGLFAADILPPWRSMMERQIAEGGPKRNEAARTWVRSIGSELSAIGQRQLKIVSMLKASA